MAHGFYRWSIPAHISALVYWFKASIYMVKVKMVLLWWVPFLTEIVTWLQWEQKGCNEELPSVSYSEMGHDPYLMQLLILQPFIPAAERKLAKEQLCYVGNSTISLQPWNCTACLKLQWAEQTPLSAHWQNTGGFPRHSLSRKKAVLFIPPAPSQNVSHSLCASSAIALVLKDLKFCSIWHEACLWENMASCLSEIISWQHHDMNATNCSENIRTYILADNAATDVTM